MHHKWISVGTLVGVCIGALLGALGVALFIGFFVLWRGLVLLNEFSESIIDFTQAGAILGAIFGAYFMALIGSRNGAQNVTKLGIFIVVMSLICPIIFSVTISVLAFVFYFVTSVGPSVSFAEALTGSLGGAIIVGIRVLPICVLVLIFYGAKYAYEIIKSFDGEGKINQDTEEEIKDISSLSFMDMIKDTIIATVLVIFVNVILYATQRNVIIGAAGGALIGTFVMISEGGFENGIFWGIYRIILYGTLAGAIGGGVIGLFIGARSTGQSETEEELGKSENKETKNEE